MDAGLKTYRQAAEQKARDQLIVSHLKYVKYILGKILVEFPATVDAENLEAAGILGLVEAANRFTPDRGVNFKTFAYQRIRGAVVDELRRNCPLPQHILKNWSIVREAIRTHEGPVSSEVLSQQTGLSIADVETCMTAIRMTAPESWHEEIVTQQNVRQHEEIETSDRHALLVQAVEELPKRMREIVTLYHIEDLTLKQIGQVVGLSESRVSRLLTSAELSLKKRLQNLEGQSASPSQPREQAKQVKR